MYFSGTTESGDIYYSTSIDRSGSKFIIVDELNTDNSYVIDRDYVNVSFDNGVTWISYNDLAEVARCYVQR